jgi:hypothetical protein
MTNRSISFRFAIMTLAYCCPAAAQMFTPAPGAPFTPGRYSSRLVTADFNLDGKPDLAITNFPQNTITVLLGSGTGGFTEASESPFSAGSLPSGIAVGDFNGDGFPDLVTTNSGANTISVFLGSGTGTFTREGTPIAVGTSPNQISVADFNGDGKQDLAVANAGGGVTVLLGNGIGGFAPTAASPLALEQAPSVSPQAISTATERSTWR